MQPEALGAKVRSIAKFGENCNRKHLSREEEQRLIAEFLDGLEESGMPRPHEVFLEEARRRIVASDGLEAARSLLREYIEGLKRELGSRKRPAVSLRGRAPTDYEKFYMWYLHTRGLSPELVSEETRFPPEVVREAIGSGPYDFLGVQPLIPGGKRYGLILRPDSAQFLERILSLDILEPRAQGLLWKVRDALNSLQSLQTAYLKEGRAKQPEAELPLERAEAAYLIELLESSFLGDLLADRIRMGLEALQRTMR